MMKAGAFILSLLIVVLSIQPTSINWNSRATCADKTTNNKSVARAGVKKTCNKETKGLTNKPAEKQNEDSPNSCNPFMTCNGCAYMPAEAHEIISPSAGESENTNWLNDETLSSFPNESWHPPELFRRL